MLVDNQNYRMVYNCSGAEHVFAIQFPFLDPQHLIVYQRVNGVQSLIPAPQYTITGAGVEAGGTLTLNFTPVANTRLVIVRLVPITQLYAYEELDNFPAKSHENALAKLTMICQQLKELTDRAVKVDITDPRTPEQYTAEYWNAHSEVVNDHAEVRQWHDEVMQERPLIIAEGNAQVQRVTAEGDAQAQRVKHEGDYEYNRIEQCAATALAHYSTSAAQSAAAAASSAVTAAQQVALARETAIAEGNRQCDRIEQCGANVLSHYASSASESSYSAAQSAAAAAQSASSASDVTAGVWAVLGNITDLTTAAATIVAAINALDARVSALEG